MIANSLLRATGHSDFARSVSPQPSISSVNALHLGAQGIYEVLCAADQGHFDIVDAAGNPLTAVANVTSPQVNKKAVFQAFFDMDVVENVCRSHGLEFADRMTFVDRYTVRMTGRVIPHGANRHGHPVRSRYDERKKHKEGRSNAPNWAAEFQASRKSREEVRRIADDFANVVKEKETQIKSFRKDVADMLKARSEASLKVKKKTEGGYQELRMARSNLRAKRKLLTPREKELQRLRSLSYYWNNVERAASSSARSSGRTVHTNTIPNWSHPEAEDRTQQLDISQLMNGTSDGTKLITFAGTDYGIRTMSETVPQTLNEIRTHLNRYSLLYGDSQNANKPSDEGEDITEQGEVEAKDEDGGPKALRMRRIDTTKALKLPAAYKMTAAQVNDA
ncbi:hypothetical protein BGX31_004410, partial [Mortierella sp. GBA43]